MVYLAPMSLIVESSMRIYIIKTHVNIKEFNKSADASPFSLFRKMLDNEDCPNNVKKRPPPPRGNYSVFSS